jgi:hypothetical protein
MLYILNKNHYICILKQITMARIKEIYMEIQNQFGEDVEVTEQMFIDFVNQMGKDKVNEEVVKS